MTAIDLKPWADEQIDTIRAEWAAGTSVAQIGRLIGRTGASVTGKAHRMGLPRRQDPIKRVRTAQEVVEAAESQKRLSATRAPLSPLSTPEFGSKSATRPPPVSPTRSCEWIDGQRGAYTKCGRPLERGSYCAEHGDRCYVGEKKSGQEISGEI